MTHYNFTVRISSRRMVQIKPTMYPKFQSLHLLGRASMRKMWRRLRAEVHICACAHPGSAFTFFFNLQQNVCACVSLEYTCCLSRKRKTGSQSSGTSGGGRAAQGCSAQIRLICLALASHCFSLPSPLPVSLPWVFPSRGSRVRIKTHMENRA